MTDSLSHPDLHLIFPVPTTAKPGEIAERIAGQIERGFRDADFGRRTAIISVETVVRDVVLKANQHAYVGRWKIFIIADADLMTTEAANTLLKTLEEPPQDTIIVLTSPRPSALPVTIVSRCQRVPFARLSEDDLVEALISEPRLGFDEKRARRVAGFALGSPGRAVRLESDGFHRQMDEIAAIMAGRKTRDVPSLVSEAGRLAFRLGRREQQEVLDLMLLWLRDVLALSECGDGARLLYAKHRKDLEAQASAMTSEVIGTLVERVDGARRAIERYSNPSIVFTSVLLDLAIARKQTRTGNGARHGG